MDKKFWLKLDKNKIILQLRDLGKRFSLRKSNNWRSFLIIFLFFVLVGAGAAIYRYNNDAEQNNNSGVSIELNEVVDSPEENGVREGREDFSEAEQNASEEELLVNSDGGTTGEEALETSGRISPGEEVRVDKEGTTYGESLPGNSGDTVVEREFPVDKENGEKAGTEETTAGVVTEPLRPVMQAERETFTLLKPVKGSVLREPGWYYHPVLEDWRYNHGVEFDGEPGDVVMAAAAGRVISIEEDAYLGIVVLVDHDNGYQTEYGHLQRAVVTMGQVVARGQEVGRLGETGISSEPSLYFALKNTESTINPQEYFE